MSGTAGVNGNAIKTQHCDTEYAQRHSPLGTYRPQRRGPLFAHIDIRVESLGQMRSGPSILIIESRKARVCGAG
jgi:hypothetical protein